MAEEKQAAEDGAAALKLANEKKFREERFKQMKSAWLEQHPDGSFSAEEEASFYQKIDAEIKNAAAAQPAAPLSKSQEALKEQLSKFSDVFQGGRFEFIGTAIKALGDFFVKLMPVFQSIMPQLKNLGGMFNPSHEETSDMNVVNTLLDKGKLNLATQMLIEEEQKLLKEMKEAFEGDKEVKEFKDSKEKLMKYHKGLETLEKDLEVLTPLKKGEVEGNLKEHLEKIERELTQINAHYRELMHILGTGTAGHLKSVPLVFDRMKPIIEAHQMLYDKEVAALPKTVTPPV